MKPKVESKKKEEEATKEKSDEETSPPEKQSKQENTNTKKTANGNIFLINKTSSENETVLEYFPDKSHYHPIKDAPWKHGERFVSSIF